MQSFTRGSSSMLDTLILTQGTPESGTETVKPEIRVLESEDTYAKVVVEPLPRGFGLTLGNPLRRILLSSTNGSAITWVKIEDVTHEYAAIPGVKEEVMELLLNIKRIRIRSRSHRPGKMRLDVTGEGRVCAGDISTSSDFEIMNPELHLATLDSDNARLSIEFNVEQGVGYQVAAQAYGMPNQPVDVLPVDAVFSPVRRINYNVERTRVGQITNFERLVMEVWTDGTIRAVEAIQQAAENLMDIFFLFSNLNRVTEEGIERGPLVVSPEIYQTPIEKLELSPRTLNCLKRSHISKVGEVLEMSDNELRNIRNFGEKSLIELKEKLVEHGVVDQSDDARWSVLESSIGELREFIGRARMGTYSPVEAPRASVEGIRGLAVTTVTEEDKDAFNVSTSSLDVRFFGNPRGFYGLAWQGKFDSQEFCNRVDDLSNQLQNLGKVASKSPINEVIVFYGETVDHFLNEDLENISLTELWAQISRNPIEFLRVNTDHFDATWTRMERDGIISELGLLTQLPINDAFIAFIGDSTKDVQSIILKDIGSKLRVLGNKYIGIEVT